LGVGVGDGLGVEDECGLDEVEEVVVLEVVVVGGFFELVEVVEGGGGGSEVEVDVCLGEGEGEGSGVGVGVGLGLGWVVVGSGFLAGSPSPAKCQVPCRTPTPKSA